MEKNKLECIYEEGFDSGVDYALNVLSNMGCKEACEEARYIIKSTPDKYF